jgi:hypothetical protein
MCTIKGEKKSRIPNIYKCARLKEVKIGAIPSGKCGECFPQLSPTQKAGFGGI